MLGPAWKHQPEASYTENRDYNLRLARCLETINFGQTALLAVHLGFSLYTSKSLSYDSIWTNPTPLLAYASFIMMLGSGFISRLSSGFTSPRNLIILILADITTMALQMTTFVVLLGWGDLVVIRTSQDERWKNACEDRSWSRYMRSPFKTAYDPDCLSSGPPATLSICWSTTTSLLLSNVLATSFWFTALATIKFLVSLKSQAVLRQRATLQHQAKSTDVAQKDTTSSGSPSTTVQTSPYPSNNAQADHAMEYVKSGTLFVSPRRMDQSPAVSPSLPQYYGTARECEHCALSNADESGSVGGASNLSSNSEGFALTPDASSVDEDSLDDGGASNLSLEYDDNWVDRGAWSPPSSEEDSWDDEGAYDWPSEDEDSSDDLGF